jgi:hypothetical protein
MQKEVFTVWYLVKHREKFIPSEEHYLKELEWRLFKHYEVIYFLIFLAGMLGRNYKVWKMNGSWRNGILAT